MAALTGLICFAEILESNIFPLRIVSFFFFGLLLFLLAIFLRFGIIVSIVFHLDLFLLLLLSIVWSVLLLTALGPSLRAVGVRCHAGGPCTNVFGYANDLFWDAVQDAGVTTLKLFGEYDVECNLFITVILLLVQVRHQPGQQGEFNPM